MAKRLLGVPGRHSGPLLPLKARPAPDMLHSPALGSAGATGIWVPVHIGLSRRYRWAAVGPWSGRLKLCCQAKERRLVTEAADEVCTYRQAFGVPEERD